MTIAFRFLARLGLFTPAEDNAMAARFAALSGTGAKRPGKRQAPSPFKFSARGNV